MHICNAAVTPGWSCPQGRGACWSSRFSARVLFALLSGICFWQVCRPGSFGEGWPHVQDSRETGSPPCPPHRKAEASSSSALRSCRAVLPCGTGGMAVLGPLLGKGRGRGEQRAPWCREEMSRQAWGTWASLLQWWLGQI